MKNKHINSIHSELLKLLKMFHFLQYFWTLKTPQSKNVIILIGSNSALNHRNENVRLNFALNFYIYTKVIMSRNLILKDILKDVELFPCSHLNN